MAYVPPMLMAPDEEVVLIPSASSYALLSRTRPATGRDVLALGVPDAPDGRDGLAPLRNVRSEVEAVGQRVLFGPQATVEALRAALRRETPWRAVHFACHARVDPESPLENELLLSPTKTSDGRLTVLDVLGLSLPTDLVVLSACQIGVGRVYRSEGVLGFTRAFMEAGARNVIVSLWPVDDEATRALMVRLYELWNPSGGDGTSLAGALRRAQAEIRSDPRWQAPEYWAAWQLWGCAE
jgi:CHAT domain-containing protein